MPRCFFRFLPLLVLSAFPLMAAGQQAGAIGEAADRVHCFGRFCVNLPAGMLRVHDQHEIREIGIDEKRWHNPGNRERVREFDSRIKAIEALATGKAAGAVQGKVISRHELETPKLQAAIYQREDNPFVATWGALLSKGPVDAWLQYDSDFTAAADWPPALLEVAQAYRVSEVNPGAMRDGGLFHLRFGAVALPYKIMEKSSVRFEYPALQIKLRISTDTLNEARPGSLKERLAANARLLGSGGRDLRIQKNQLRLAAGMTGEESITRSDAPGLETLAFKWNYAGDGQAELKPRMVIEMDSAPGQDEQKLALWNRLLQSLRPAASSAVRF